MSIRANIRCPSCSGPLVPVKLRCAACALTVAGHFAANEFATLGEDDLHFLRIFVRCEGRIRDMESALGVSYPTIKARLAQLKGALEVMPMAAEKLSMTVERVEEEGAAAVLRELAAGRMTYEQALEQLKNLKKGTDV